MNPEAAAQNLELDAFGDFDRDGFQIFKSAIDESTCDLLAAELTRIFEEQISLKNRIAGVRNLLHNCERVRELANSAKITSILREVVGSSPFPVRAIFFDKNPDSNWLVPWHQDLAIAVAARIETPGFTGWSTKDGVLHVHPPREVLEQMITLRLHLDDCTADNGVLKVLPFTHRRGKLGTSEISECAKSHQVVNCEVRRGGVLLMRPLLLHSSSPADKPQHRRVLHIEYAAEDLPNGLKWFEN
jgi:ectoine hydroxylase-related dioxygenase (phytanoyl-CoA dioxygenase family)